MFLEDIYSGPVARGDVGARCRGGGCDRFRGEGDRCKGEGLGVGRGS